MTWAFCFMLINSTLFYQEKGEAPPAPGDRIEIEEYSLELGALIYEKYGVATYKLVHHDLGDA